MYQSRLSSIRWPATYQTPGTITSNATTHTMKHKLKLRVRTVLPPLNQILMPDFNRTLISSKHIILCLDLMTTRMTCTTSISVARTSHSLGLPSLFRVARLTTTNSEWMTWNNYKLSFEVHITKTNPTTLQYTIFIKTEKVSCKKRYYNKERCFHINSG